MTEASEALDGGAPADERASKLVLEHGGAQSSSELLERLRTRMPARSRYRIDGEVGRGGMGAVLRIWDEDLRRMSAMKVVLGDGDARSNETPSIAANKLGRFLEEAQVTGQLDHPGIVPVHELGLARDGRVYFTMRLVEGDELGTIFGRVRTEQDGWNQTRALGVLLKVCEALAFAHAKGVIHRDLKPANVMVGRFGEVYVMDWGLARVLGQQDHHDLRLDRADAARPSAVAAPRPTVVESERAAQRTGSTGSPLMTLDGTVLGTPAYMPPEQARGEIEALGPTADVYALGAMLYELIAGEPPFAPAGARSSPIDVLRAVLAGPPRALAQCAPRAPGELIAICEKAMARDARARYRDMAELGEDLRAYLERRVVQAYETGAWAETKKWVQRNKALASALLAVVLAIAVGSVAFAVQAERATAAAARAEANAHAESLARAEAQRARASAEESARVAQAVTLFVQNALVQSDPNAGGQQDYRVSDAIDKARAALAGGELASDPAIEWTLELTIARILDGNGRSADALALAEHALATSRRLHAGDHADVASALERVASYSLSLGRPEAALAKFEEALAMQRRLDASDRSELALSMNNLALTLKTLGRLDEALARYQEALAMMRRLTPGDDRDVASCMVNIAICLDALGRSGEALPEHESALAMRRRLYPGDHPDIVSGLSNLAGTFETLGRNAEALAHYEEALAMSRRLFGGDHPMVASLENNVGMWLQRQGRNSEALVRLEESLAINERLFQGNHPSLATSWNNLGWCQLALNRREDALLSLQAALEMNQALYTGDHPDTARSLGNVALSLHRMERDAEALPYAQRAEAMDTRLVAAGHASHARYAELLGQIRAALAK